MTSITPRSYLFFCAQDGWIVNHKRIQRIWQKQGLQVPYRRKFKKAKGCAYQKLHPGKYGEGCVASCERIEQFLV
ncbi:MAG: transposase [Planctomycetes bacterium]|nr:transposase [Planctomycetota bacterium]